MNKRAVADLWKNSQLNVMPQRPPWRPSREDGKFMLEMAGQILQRSGEEPAIGILGVTPEIIQLDWPRGAEIVAIDSSPGMIASTWRPRASGPSSALCARWQAMPVRNAAFDAVVGDGSLNALPELSEYGNVFREAARVLKRGGAMILRCFIRPERSETPEQVLSLAKAGAFPTTAAFRLRFAFALTEADGSVGLATLLARFNALVPDRDRLARATGWPRQHIDLADVDKYSRIRLTFPTRPELRSLCEPIFAVERSEQGTYTQAQHCPTLLFRPV